ncbi:MAG: tetratricopeptide repeat protein [Ignavibacteria bacterium]|nr:tetratricopeptide repeat protein [Ignavibacteria bacterium]
MKYLFIIFIVFINSTSSQDTSYVSYSVALEVLNSGAYEKAVDYFNRYLKVSSMHDEAYFQRGNAYYELRKYDEALSDYLKAYELGFNNSRMLYRVASIYREKKFDNAAIDYLNKALNINSGFIEAYLMLGEIYTEAGDYKKADEIYSKIVKLAPLAREKVSSIAEMSMALGNYRDAVKYYTIAISFDSSDFNNIYSLGVAYYHLNDTSNALSYLRKSSLMNKTHGMPYFYLAKIYSEQGNYHRAAECLTEALSIGSLTVELADVYKTRAMCYSKIKDYLSALEDLNSAIRLNASFPDLYVLRGIVQYEKGDDTLALKDFNKAISLSPDISLAYTYRGLIYLNRTLPQLARDDFTRALELSPDDTLVLFHMGNFMLEEEKYMEAINYYNRAFSVNPKFYRIFENRGIAYYNLGYYRQASVDFDAAIKHNPSLITKLKPLFIDARRKSGM